MTDIFRDPKTETICPYIGLPSDTRTAMENPSPQNYCHNLKPPSSPSLTHQSGFCLNVTFKQCQYYSEDAGEPGHVVPVKKSRKKRKWVPLTIAALLGIALLGGLLFAGGQIFPRLFPPPAEKATTPVVEAAAAVPVSTSEPTLMEIVIEPEVTEPAITAVSTLVIENQVEVATEVAPADVFTEETPQPPLIPVQPGRVFLLHRVAGGEDLIAIAEKYNTSVEAIRAVNYNMAPELWVDSMIVVPENQIDVSGVTPMIPLEITGSEKTVQDLAEDHAVSPELLGEINSRSTTYHFQIGDWVIMPQAVPSPT